MKFKTKNLFGNMKIKLNKKIYNQRLGILEVQ